MFRLMLDLLCYEALFGVLLFLPAGRIHWTRAWILLIALFVIRTISIISVARVSRDVLVERSKIPIHSGQPIADKILVLLFMATFAALVAFASYDVFHLHLFHSPGWIVSVTGMILFLSGWSLVAIVLRTNTFAITVVRNQKERQHRVIDTGIYGILRHPMYAGLGCVIVGFSLWLGSYAGALLAIVPMGILVIRIHLEENFLKRELKGYSEYVSKVRWRLLPGIW